MTSENEGSTNRGFWKKARGDHLIVASIFSSIVMTTAIALTVFKNVGGIGVVLWYFFSMLGGSLIPLVVVPDDFIDNKIPPYHFWRELIS